MYIINISPFIIGNMTDGKHLNTILCNFFFSQRRSLSLLIHFKAAASFLFSFKRPLRYWRARVHNKRKRIFCDWNMERFERDSGVNKDNKEPKAHSHVYIHINTHSHKHAGINSRKTQPPSVWIFAWRRGAVLAPITNTRNQTGITFECVPKRYRSRKGLKYNGTPLPRQ